MFHVKHWWRGCGFVSRETLLCGRAGVFHVKQWTLFGNVYNDSNAVRAFFAPAQDSCACFAEYGQDPINGIVKRGEVCEGKFAGRDASWWCFRG